MRPGPGGKQLFSKGQVISVATTRWSCLYTLIRRLCNPANELNFPAQLSLNVGLDDGASQHVYLFDA